MGGIPGPCADKVVTCTLVTTTGRHFVGRNDCMTPQPVCPREPGEGYAKCRSVCHQPAHAELVALWQSCEPFELEGATAFIEGIDFVCKQCSRELVSAGVRTFVFGPPDVKTG